MRFITMCKYYDNVAMKESMKFPKFTFNEGLHDSDKILDHFVVDSLQQMQVLSITIASQQIA